MCALDPMRKTLGQEGSGWNTHAEGGYTKTVLMKRTWTEMENCAPYAKPHMCNNNNIMV